MNIIVGLKFYHYNVKELYLTVKNNKTNVMDCIYFRF